MIALVYFTAFCWVLAAGGYIADRPKQPALLMALDVIVVMLLIFGFANDWFRWAVHQLTAAQLMERLAGVAAVSALSTFVGSWKIILMGWRASRWVKHLFSAVSITTTRKA
ncbi:hypothetical protein [Angelakisella massiliensis]|uniref:hypothetical protein n=1 Tax=Angelakisella massiliensis TaxID=1871018 RepID=UPI0024B163E0|nr:hypothetical protein [Angelakisella massiliensis]